MFSDSISPVRSNLKQCLSAILFLSLPSLHAADLPGQALTYSDSLNNQCVANTPGDSWGWNGFCSCRTDQAIGNFGQHVYTDDNLLIITATQVPGSCHDSGSASVYEIDGSGNINKITELVSSARFARDKFAFHGVTMSDRYVAISSQKEDKGYERYTRDGRLHIFDRETWQEVTVIEQEDIGALFVSDTLLVQNEFENIVVYNLDTWTVRQEIEGRLVKHTGNQSYLNEGRFATNSGIYLQSENSLFNRVYEIPERPGISAKNMHFNGRLYSMYYDNVVSYTPYTSYREIRTWYFNGNTWTEAPSLRDELRVRKFVQDARYKLLEDELAVYSYHLQDGTGGFEIFKFDEDRGWILKQSFDSGSSQNATLASPMSFNVQSNDSMVAWEGSTSYAAIRRSRNPESIQTMVYEKNDQGIWSQTIFDRETPSSYSFPYYYLEPIKPGFNLTGKGLFFITTQPGELLIPDFATSDAQPSTTDCNYQDAELYNGWGWNPATGESCAPIAPAEQSLLDDCDYSNAMQFDGWGWNPITRESCQPRVDETGEAMSATAANNSCDYSNADINAGWGWNAIEMVSCAPMSETNNPNNDNNVDNGCDYTDAEANNGWGWNAETLEACPPAATR